MNALQVLDKYSKLPFSAENMYLTISVRTAMPIQANSSVSEMDDKTTGGKKSNVWYHLLASYKSNYTSTAETGELLDTNATLKQLKIKFDKRSTEGVTASRFKDFFDSHFVGKAFFTFPVLSESPTRSKKRNGDKEYYEDLKDSTDVMIHPDFKLLDFMREYEASIKK